jgi:hypothetical protein
VGSARRSIRDDPSVPYREARDRERLAFAHGAASGGAIDARRPHEQAEPRVASDWPATAAAPRSSRDRPAGGRGSALGTDIRVEQDDRLVEFKRGSINEPQDTAFDHPPVDAFIAESTTWRAACRTALSADRARLTKGPSRRAVSEKDNSLT